MLRGTSDACWWSLVVTRLMKNQHLKLTRKQLFNNFKFWIQPLVNLMFMTFGLNFLLFGFGFIMFNGIGSLVQKTKNFRDLVMNSLPWSWIQKPKKFGWHHRQLETFWWHSTSRMCWSNFLFKERLGEAGDSTWRRVWLCGSEAQRISRTHGSHWKWNTWAQFDSLAISFMVSTSCPVEIKTKP